MTIHLHSTISLDKNLSKYDSILREFKLSNNLLDQKLDKSCLHTRLEKQRDI